MCYVRFLQHFYQKPPKIVNDYLFGAVLGEGSFAKVKECMHTVTLIRYAVKIMKLSRLRKIPGGWAVRKVHTTAHFDSKTFRTSSAR